MAHFQGKHLYFAKAGGQVLQDARLNLDALAWTSEDLPALLSAWYEAVEGDQGVDLEARYQGIDDLAAALEAWAWGFDDLDAPLQAASWQIGDITTLCLAAYSGDRKNLAAALRAARHECHDLAMPLESVSPWVREGDFVAFLSATDGVVTDDMGLCLSASKPLPAFVATVAQRLTANISEGD